MTLYEEPTVTPNYVQFKFLSPTNGQMKRYRWTFDAGRIAESERPQYLRAKCAELSLKLRLGYNPNICDYKQFSTGIAQDKNHMAGPNILAAIDDVLAIRKQYQKRTGYKYVNNKMKQFKEWIVENDLSSLGIADFNRAHINKYLADLVRNKAGQRTRWNHLTALSTLFEDFEKHGMAEGLELKNPCKKIPRRTNMVIAQTARVIYTEQEVKRLSRHLQAEDPYLLAFIHFIIYAFMRPTATLRFVTVGMIDLEAMEFNLPHNILKTGERHKRIIQKVLLPTIQAMELHKYPPDYYIFSRSKTPGPKPVGEEYFSERFKKVKAALRLPKNYDMYSLRHTFATDLVRSGTPWHKIMKITGHKTLSAFERYVRFIQAEKAEDLSDAYSLRL